MTDQPARYCASDPHEYAEDVRSVVADMMRRSQVCRKQALRLREQADHMDKRADDWIEAARAHGYDGQGVSDADG